MRNIYFPGKRLELTDESESDKSVFYACGLIVTAVFIILFGLTMLYSTSYGIAGSKYFYHQLMWAGIGLIGGVITFLIGYRRLSDYSLLFIGMSIALLAVADFCFPAVKGAHRWIRFSIGGFPLSIQPSEFAKLAIAMFLAKYCSDNLRFVNNLFFKRGPLPACAICGSVMLFVIAGKDLGTVLLLAGVLMLVLFVAGLRLRVVFLPILFGLPPLAFMLRHFDAERWSRVTSFLEPEIYQKTDGYQLWNSLLALGSGGLFGIGFMESRLKAKYLPEAHTDFILSIVGEELGMISLCCVIGAYIIFMIFALKISFNSRTKQGMLLGAGITFALILQAIINISVVSGALPTKGMPAPFISYGGSNLLTCMIAVALLVNIAAETAMPDLNDEIIRYVKRKIPFFGKQEDE